jgi:CheY-like chemotaxis protein
MKSYTVLVAEDDAALLDSIRIRLSSEGYRVLCAHDGYQAVAMAAHVQPDMLILDIHMPAGDGFSVQDRVRKMPELSSVPIVYVTGDDSANTLEMAHRVGASWFLRKPFESSDLLRLVREALEPNQTPFEWVIAAEAEDAPWIQ